MDKLYLRDFRGACYMHDLPISFFFFYKCLMYVIHIIIDLFFVVELTSAYLKINCVWHMCQALACDHVTIFKYIACVTHHYF